MGTVVGGWVDLRLRSGCGQQPIAVDMRSLPGLLKLGVTQRSKMALDLLAMFRRDLLFAVPVFVYALKARVTGRMHTRYPRGPLRLHDPMALPSRRVGSCTSRIVTALVFVAFGNTVA